MDINCAKISNRAKNTFEPENSQFEFKGQKGVGCLVSGVNVPKADGMAMPTKVCRTLIESFLRRPSLSDEAMNAIFDFANNGVLVEQSPSYPSYASASAIFMLKNKFVYAAVGDNVIFHFVDGVLEDVFSGSQGGEPVFLGTPRGVAPKISEQHTFGKGENTFLICSAALAGELSESAIEGALARATTVSGDGSNRTTNVNCEKWLKELFDMANKNDSKDYSAAAASLPQKKKKKKTIIIIAIIAAVVLIGGFFAFGAFGRMRQPEAPTAPDKSMGDPVQPPAPGQGFAETGPNGETPPAAPNGPNGETPPAVQ